MVDYIKTERINKKGKAKHLRKNIDPLVSELTPQYFDGLTQDLNNRGVDRYIANHLNTIFSHVNEHKRELPNDAKLDVEIVYRGIDGRFGTVERALILNPDGTVANLTLPEYTFGHSIIRRLWPYAAGTAGGILGIYLLAQAACPSRVNAQTQGQQKPAGVVETQKPSDTEKKEAFVIPFGENLSIDYVRIRDVNKPECNNDITNITTVGTSFDINRDENISDNEKFEIKIPYTSDELLRGLVKYIDANDKDKANFAITLMEPINPTRAFTIVNGSRHFPVEYKDGKIVVYNTDLIGITDDYLIERGNGTYRLEKSTATLNNNGVVWNNEHGARKFGGTTKSNQAPRDQREHIRQRLPRR